MKIVYLHQYFNTPGMAGSTRSYEIARHLAASGHEVEIVTTYREPTDKTDWYETVESGFRVHWLPLAYSNKMSYPERIKAFLSFAVKAAAKAHKINADVVFATSTPLTIVIPGIVCSTFRRIPMVLEIRDLWPSVPIAMGALNNPVMRMASLLLEKIAYAKADRVIALSPGMAEGVMRCGFPPERLSTIPNFSNTVDFGPEKANGAIRQQLGIRPDQVMLCYIGTFGRANGVTYLVGLAKALGQDDRFRIVLIGDGYEREKAIEEAERSGVLNKNIFILPPVPKAEVPAIMADSDISISTFIPVKELEHNSPNKFFDGLASGCCIAINHGGWQADLLTETEAGIVLSAEPSAAARQLQEVADMPGRLQRMGENARKLGESRFNARALCAQVEAVISAAAAGSRSPVAR
jgi:glycosyltransferase involved in cell wall biosynthesis